MAEPVLHHPRLAWDGARICVRVIESGHLCAWLDEQLGLVLGPDFHRALFDSWDRLWWSERPDAPYVEAGPWRARAPERPTGPPRPPVPPPHPPSRGRPPPRAPAPPPPPRAAPVT